MNLIILSPDQEIFAGPVTSIAVPGEAGGFQMLERHAPIVSSLTKGPVRIVKSDGSKMEFNIAGGFVEMLNDEVALLVSGIEQK